MKKKVRDVFETISDCRIGGSIDEVIFLFQDLKKRAGLQGFTDLTISSIWQNCFSVNGLREETDAEYQKRLKREERQLRRKQHRAKTIQEKELKLLSKLKKKYE